MPNPNNPFGFRLGRHVAGGTPGRTNAYPIASAYATAIFYGDPVATDGAGNIIKATNATSILGVFLGVNLIGADGVPVFSPMWVAGTTPPANTKVEALVCDDEFQMYEVQSTGTLAATAVGKLANLDSAGGGTVSTGNSKAGISGVAGSENQFIVERILELPVNVGAGNIAMSTVGQYAIAEVSIAKSARGIARVVPASTEF